MSTGRFTLLLLTFALVGCSRHVEPPVEEAQVARAQAAEPSAPQVYYHPETGEVIPKTGEGVGEIIWDMSQDNHISQVDWSDEITGDRFLINQDLNLSIKFPAGYSVDERANFLICTRGAEAPPDRVTSVEFRLPKCTADEAARRTKEFITRWNLMVANSDALPAVDAWRAQAGKERANTFFTCRHDNFPMIDLEIVPSHDAVQPWSIPITFTIRRPPLPQEVVDCVAAIQVGNTEKAIQLINAGVNPNAIDVQDNPLLVDAVDAGNLKLVEYLLAKGAQVNAQGGIGGRPLWYALFYGRLEIAELLHSKGADVNLSDDAGRTLLHSMCESKAEPVPNDQLVRWLVDRGAQVNVFDEYGRTPLHEAANEGLLAAAEALIAAGADVNAKMKNGRTPLDEAVGRQNEEIAELLRKHNAQRGSSST